MTKTFGLSMACATLAICLTGCPSNRSPAGPSTAPAADPLTVESYATRLIKVHQELTDLGRHTVPIPEPSAEFRIACQCTVVVKPDVVPVPPGPPVEDAVALERGLNSLHILVEAAKAGRLPDVRAVQ